MMNEKEAEMKVMYTSPLFSINGSPRQFMVPLAGLKYHQKRDAAVLAMQSLGGIHAPNTPEVQKLMRAIRSAKRAIERNGYFSTPVGV